MEELNPRLVRQDRFLQETHRFIRENELLHHDETVLVAVSGGLDSTVLAHVLGRMKNMLGIKVELVHLDHGTRGVTSQREGMWVRNLGERHALPTHALELKATEASQAGLREARRSALWALAKKCGAARIATAHHADDNAETLLMRALQGTGPLGLGGIAPAEGPWIRPLLWATRADLEEYCRRYRLGWIEDPSNGRGDYLRNRLRLEALPLLERLRPGSSRNLSRLADRAHEEEKEWRDWITQQLEEPIEALSLGWLERWPRPLRRRILRVWLERLQFSQDEGSAALTEALLRGDEVIHSEGAFVRRSDMLIFSRERDFRDRLAKLTPIEMGKRVDLGESIAWTFLRGSRQLEPSRLQVYFAFRAPEALTLQDTAASSSLLAWDQLPWPLALRARTAHDRQLPGLEAAFDRKQIPQPFRRHWPLLVSCDDPSQVVGALGVLIFEKHRLSGLGRCVSVESFFEDRLKPKLGS